MSEETRVRLDTLYMPISLGREAQGRYEYDLFYDDDGDPISPTQPLGINHVCDAQTIDSTGQLIEYRFVVTPEMTARDFIRLAYREYEATTNRTLTPIDDLGDIHVTNHRVIRIEFGVRG